MPRRGIRKIIAITDDDDNNNDDNTSRSVLRINGFQYLCKSRRKSTRFIRPLSHDVKQQTATTAHYSCLVLTPTIARCRVPGVRLDRRRSSHHALSRDHIARLDSTRRDSTQQNIILSSWVASDDVIEASYSRASPVWVGGEDADVDADDGTDDAEQSDRWELGDELDSDEHTREHDQQEGGAVDAVAVVGVLRYVDRSEQGEAVGRHVLLNNIKVYSQNSIIDVIGNVYCRGGSMRRNKGATDDVECITKDQL